MKYMLLIPATQADWQGRESWPADDLRAHVEFMRDLDAELRRAGELVSDGSLAAPRQALVVSVRRPGAAGDASAPGPREFLAGFRVVDCETPARAAAIAAQLSAAPGPGGAPLNQPVEVRPLMRAAGEEM